MDANTVKTVTWTISNAVILPGKGKDATAKQPIFTIEGTILRSDSTDKNPQKGKTFDWTPELKAKGYKIDLSKFDTATATGTITITGEIGKGGRKHKAAITETAKLKGILDLA